MTGTNRKYQHYLHRGISFVFVLVLVQTIIWACVDNDYYWEKDLPRFFQPDAASAGSGRYEPYYLTARFFNVSEKQQTGKAFSGYGQNVEDWYVFLHRKVTKSDIDHFLNQSELIVEQPNRTDRLEQFLKQYKDEKLIRWLVQQKQYETLYYLYLAKRNEFPASALEDSWNYFHQSDYYGTAHLRDATNVPGVSIGLEQQLGKEQDPFLKKRLVFQLIKNYRYTRQDHKVDSLFQQYYFRKQPEDELYYKAMNYATDALVNEKRWAKANYYAALLFDIRAEEHRAFINFNTDIPVTDALPYCSDAKEKAMVYVLDAFKSYGVNIASLTNAYHYDPSNDAIDHLIIREINKADHTLMPATSSHYEYAENSSRDKQSMKELRSFLVMLAQKNTAKKDFYYLCLAHIEMLTGNYAASHDYFSQVRFVSLTAPQQVQFCISKTLLLSESGNLRDRQVLDELYRQMTMLDKLSSRIYYEDLTLNSVRLIISRAFLRADDYARAYLVDQSLPEQFDRGTLLDETIRPRDIDTIIRILAHPDSHFDRYAVTFNKINPSRLRNIQASLYMRQNNPEKALGCYELAGAKDTFRIDLSGVNTEPDGHAFHAAYLTASTYDFEGLSPAEAAAKKKRYDARRLHYTNYSLIKSIVQLKKDLRNKKGDPALNYFYLASLYFELTYHGRAYAILNYDGWWSSGEADYFAGETDELKAEYKKHYYGCTWSMPYYRLALKHSKDEELSARCLYALYRCNRYWKRFNGNDQATPDLRYLYQLHDDYSNTRYYRIKECWGLNAYVDELRAGKVHSNN